MIKHEVHRVPVTALAFSKDYLFAGEGSILRIHRRHDNVLLSTVEVFSSQAIHGIAVHSNGVIVWGGRLVATYTLVSDESSPVKPESTFEAFDWILDISVSPEASGGRRKAALITAHNALLMVDLEPSPSSSERGLKELTSNSKCILYSAHLYWLSDEHILVSSGTVFGDIIVWSCILREIESPSSILHHVLAGHDGSIFGVQVFDRPVTESSDHPSRLLASCSDDRTVRIWDISLLPETATNPQAAADLTSARETGFGANVADVLPDSTSGGRCIAKAWGHASRIWGVQFITSNIPNILAYVVSFGEDATCQYWSLEASEREQYSLSHLGSSAPHSGKNIWSWAIAQDSEDDFTIASGGADGSIALEPKSVPFVRESNSIQTWSIQDFVSVCPEQSQRGRQDKLRSYAFLAQNKLLVTTDAGNTVILAQNEDGTSNINWISKEPKLQGYSVVTSIPRLSIAFLAGMDGSVLLYDSNGIRELVKSTGKTAALFAQCLFSSPQGVQQVGLLVTNVEAKHALYSRFDLVDEPIAVQTNDRPSQWTLILPAGFVTTSFLAVSLDKTNENTLLVLGSRTGSIATFLLGKGSTEEENFTVPHQCLLQEAHGTDAVTALAWVASTSSTHDSGHVFSVGRDGTYALHRLSCPGSAMDLHLVNRTSLPLGTNIEGLHIDEDTNHVLVWGFRSKQFVVFDTTNEEEIMTVSCGGANRSWKFELERDSLGGHFAWTKASQLCLYSQVQHPRKVLDKGSHGREIKAVAVSPKSPIDGGILFATGAEDTDIKLFSYHAKGTTPHFRCLRTLRKHNTGIQQLEWSSDGQYLFSSGGFEEFFVWKVETAPLIDLGVACESVCPTESALPDLRIMGFSVDQGSHGLTITMARSDSTLRMYLYSPGQDKPWHILMAGNYLTSCLTQCLHLRRDGFPETLITAGTDGHIAFYPLKDTARVANPLPAEPDALEWAHRSKIHQNTIHCMALHWFDHKTCLLLTGGDDNGIAFSICTWTSKDQNYPQVNTVIVPRAHAAAVTGLEVISSAPHLLTVATTSIDQRVKIWQVHYDPQLPGVDGLEIKRKENHFTAVADVSGLAVLDSSSIIVCGVGMDVWRHCG